MVREQRAIMDKLPMINLGMPPAAELTRYVSELRWSYRGDTLLP